MTKTIDQFFADHGNNTQKIFNHGFGECVAVANAYEDEVVGGGFISTPLTLYAKDWWNNFDNSAETRKNYVKVGAGESPQKGDVAVWDRFPLRAGGTIPHIAIVNTFINGVLNCYTQSSSTKVHFENLSRTGLLGYLRPKKFVIQAVQASAPAPSAPVGQTEYVKIAGDYRSFYDAPRGKVLTKLLPNTYGEGGKLTYKVLGRDGDYVKIERQDGSGQGWIYVGTSGGANTLTEFFNA